MLYGYQHLPLATTTKKKKKKSVTYRKTYATKITKCVHLVSFIIADSL